MNLNDKHLSFLITFFAMSIVVLILFNIHLSGNKEPEILFEMAIDDTITEEELKLLEQEEEPQELIKTHMAYNKDAKSKFEEELDEFKTLEEIMEEGKKAESEDEENPDDESNDNNDSEENKENDNFMTSSGGSGSITSSAKVKKRTLDSDGDKTTEDIVKNNVANNNTSISYSLKDRMHRKLPNPIYTCAQRGKIVINVKVDNFGNVIEATFNQASSSSRNGCLVDNAIAYALKSKFEKNSQKREQLGSITYLFQQD